MMAEGQGQGQGQGQGRRRQTQLFFVGLWTFAAAFAGACSGGCGEVGEEANYRVVNLAVQAEPQGDSKQAEAPKPAPTVQAKKDSVAEPSPLPVAPASQSVDAAAQLKISVKGRGKLSQKAVLKILQKNLSQLERCDDAGLPTFSLTVKINKAGRVEYAKDRGGLDDKLWRCIKTKVKRWRFAKPRGGAVYVTVQR